MRSSSEWNATTTSRPPGLQHALRGGERRRQLVELVVDEDAQRLERPRRRMDRAGRACTTRADDLRQRPRGRDRRLVARAHDGAGNGARAPLLAERRDDRGELALGGTR